MISLADLDDRPAGPQSWEAFADTVPERYARHGGLEQLVERLDRELDARSAAALRTIRILGQDLQRAAQRALQTRCAKCRTRRAPCAECRRRCDPFFAVVVGALVVGCYDLTRRMAGAPEMAVARLQRPAGAPPFGSLTAALAFWLGRDAQLGKGGGPPAVAEGLDEAVAATIAVARRPGRGFLRVAPSRSSSGRAQGEATVLLVLEIDRAVQASGLNDLELWLVAATTVGESTGRARRRRQGGVEEALVVRRVGELVEAWNARTGDHVAARGLAKVLARVRGDLELALVARELIPRPIRRARCA